MSQYGSWSVKGVDDRARAVAKEKARLKGVTLGDYINNLLLEGHSEAGPRDYFEPMSSPRPGALDSLAQRIEAVEARSTLAITGIDQSVLGLLARLENTENSTSAMAAEVERMIDELRETHEELHDKVGALESDESGQQSLEAMKALEDALGKLASHVYEEGRLTQDETMAMKGRVEAGFNDLNDRVEGMEVKVETTLADAAKRVEKAVQEAELRAEGTSRHLSERFSNIESSVATKLSKVDEVDARMKAVEGDVSGAISSMESTLARIQDRLHRAETTTDTALKALEHTFANLDERIDAVAAMANPEKADAWRAELEQRFDALAADLRTGVEQSRRQLAEEIERAAAGARPELMGELETRVHDLERKDATDQIEHIGEQVATLSDTLEKRIGESERRSADAIEQVGEQVATAIKHVQARQEQGQRALTEKLAAVETRQETRLSDALCNISDRLTEMQNQTATAVSPVQRAIVSLASRLEALEDFNAPPNAQQSVSDLPNLPELEVDTRPIELAEVDQPGPDLALEATPEEIADPFSTETLETEEQDEFIAGLPDFDEETRETKDFEESEYAEASDDWEVSAPDERESLDADEDYLVDSASMNELDPDGDAEDEAVSDPLAELGSWEEAQQEARDSDVFADSEEPAAFDELLPTFEEDLAHNTDELDPTESDLEDVPADEDASDYLSRARTAAIAAASDNQRDGRSRRGRRSAASTPAKGGKSGNGKLPIIAAASVFAIAAAGAGGWVALRGKQVTADTNTPAIATKSSLAETQAQPVEEPSLGGVEFAEATNVSLEETLFEEEGSAAGIEELQPSTPAEPIEMALPVDLPVIPDALTVERAASNGNPIAQYQLGEARLEAQDLAQGADLIRSAAEQGLPAAQYRLAKLHERGIGVPRDFAEARAWTERAALGGNVKAMHDLAVFYADGEGGPQSYAAAAEWFRKAADFGIVDSQYNLAVLYENGLGISPSQVEALYWYEVAALNGDASAPSNVASLRDALPLEQAQQAQRRAASWSIATIDSAANGTFGTQTWDRSTRNQIEAIQTVLNGLGYDAGPADGLAGAGTRTAIRAFQADSGLATTGEIDAALIEALNAEAQSLAG
ncbi:MAG: peptidoglycan-binding protein [Hyphomonadaceae bacterium]|nr:peptidoglycan-binding protein [Hyphomonadaceae bacterium]